MGAALHQQAADEFGTCAQRNDAAAIRRVYTILSDYGREFCGRPDYHPYELFLQLEGIEHRTTKVHRPQINGFIERLHRTLLVEHFHITGRTTWYKSVEQMQTDLDSYPTTSDHIRAG